MIRTDLVKFVDRIYEAGAELELLPHIVQTLIDDLHLDNTELTKEEKFFLGESSNKIYSVLALTQHAVRRAKAGIEQAYNDAKAEAAAKDKDTAAGQQT